MLRRIATSAVAHAERAVYKRLDGHFHRRGHIADLLERHFARHHDLPEPRRFQPLRLFRRAVVHLRGGVQRNGRQVQLQQCQILHNERVHPGAVELPHQTLRLGQFLVPQDGVERHVHTGVEQMGVLAQCGNVLHAVARCRACPEVGTAYVHGIGSVADGFHAAGQVAGRGEKFDGLHDGRGYEEIGKKGEREKLGQKEGGRVSASGQTRRVVPTLGPPVAPVCPFRSAAMRPAGENGGAAHDGPAFRGSARRVPLPCPEEQCRAA